MRHASLCTGIGACELAATWLGWENAFSCEINTFCQTILKYHYPNAQHYGNIFETDFSEWANRIDILTAGFPCQPFSVAGARKGSDDDRYLWPEVLRVINEVRPTWFIGENVAGITSMVLSCDEIEVGSYKDVFGESYQETEMRQQFVVERICRDLERIGYSVQPIVIPSCAVGAPHRRDRIWFIANANSTKLQKRFKARGRARSTEIETGVDNGNKRFGGLRDASNTHKFNGDISRFCASEFPQQQTPGVFENITSDSNSKLCQQWNNQESERRNSENFRAKSFNCKPNWQNFPAQSPVCCGNDGLSSRLFGITFSKHREESIKAFGNSMVPQVVLEIFKSIQEIEK